MVFKTRIDWSKELDNLIALDKNGKSMIEIGDHYGVSRQRIKQVFSKYALLQTHWNSKRSKIREARHYKWGDREQDLYRVKREKYRSKKAAAQRLGIDFSIPFSEIVFPKRCPILDLEIDYEAEKAQENSPSFDRIDPTKGYISGNVHIISWRANRIKNNANSSELRLIANYLDKMQEL